MLGVGGKHLVNAPASGPVTAYEVITFATTTASSVISWCTMTPDYGVYHNRKASSMRVFIYTYLGFFVASVRLRLSRPSHSAVSDTMHGTDNRTLHRRHLRSRSSIHALLGERI